ncbi:MND1-interacting protein 1-like isoform X2 [Aristolochia californica]|uniref:MND1-interacting protein 1-like isoform X2 n=1 Tax=Aristolochia californica TaxID=171875 RepID=UPI0035DA1225
MGCSVREKALRNNRKPRPSIKVDDHHSHGNPSLIATSTAKPLNQSDPSGAEKLSNLSPSPNFDETGWGYCTEDQLEELLLKNLEFLYNEAISKLIALGYDEDLALKAVLRNGHCYGSMDVLTNILHNAIAYINSISSSNNNGSHSEEPDLVFANLRQLEEYSLAGMVCLLQQVRPQLSKGDAMWCLLMSDLHVGRASTMEIPVLPSSTSNEDHGGAYDVCKFHGSWGVGGTADLPANGSAFDATMMSFAPSGFRANSKAIAHSQVQSHTCPSSSYSSGEAVNGTALGSETSNIEESKDNQNLDAVDSVLGSLGNLSLDDKSDGTSDQKNEMILTLMHQIRELEVQVKERKEWAHQKALQAARKLSSDLTELKTLRMEREETLRLKKGKQALEDTAMKRLSEMENALRKASGQVDRANAAVRRLETENAEIRAEMEASKLSASESVTTCLEVAKREKKCLKRLLAWEKQKIKLQEEVSEEKEKITQLQHQLVLIKDAQKETEVKWRQEMKAKELAIAQAEEERRAKEAAEASVKRRQEVLRRKIEIDFQRYKDDIQRLEQELSRLKATTESTQISSATNILPARDSDAAKPPKETNAKLLHELQKLLESSKKDVTLDRECLICMKEEVSVVFLPCAHQVICVNCNEEHEKKAKSSCPCCNVKIEQRIRVYGVAS